MNHILSQSKNKKILVISFQSLSINPNNTTNVFELFASFKAANAINNWNLSLIQAVQNCVLVGHIDPHVIMLGGSENFLEVIKFAWMKQILKPPLGFSIQYLGELCNFLVSKTPQCTTVELEEALCKCICELVNTGMPSNLKYIMRHVVKFLPLSPDLIFTDTENLLSLDMVKSILEGLQQKGLVYNTGHGYNVMTADKLRVAKWLGDLPDVRQSTSNNMSHKSSSANHPSNNVATTPTTQVPPKLPLHTSMDMQNNSYHDNSASGNGAGNYSLLKSNNNNNSKHKSYRSNNNNNNNNATINNNNNNNNDTINTEDCLSCYDLQVSNHHINNNNNNNNSSSSNNNNNDNSNNNFNNKNNSNNFHKEIHESSHTIVQSGQNNNNFNCGDSYTNNKPRIFCANVSKKDVSNKQPQQNNCVKYESPGFMTKIICGMKRLKLHWPSNHHHHHHRSSHTVVTNPTTSTSSNHNNINLTSYNQSVVASANLNSRLSQSMYAFNRELLTDDAHPTHGIALVTGNTGNGSNTDDFLLPQLQSQYYFSNNTNSMTNSQINNNNNSSNNNRPFSPQSAIYTSQNNQFFSHNFNSALQNPHQSSDLRLYSSQQPGEFDYFNPNELVQGNRIVPGYLGYQTISVTSGTQLPTSQQQALQGCCSELMLTTDSPTNNNHNQSPLVCSISNQTSDKNNNQSNNGGGGGRTAATATIFQLVNSSISHKNTNNSHCNKQKSSTTLSAGGADTDDLVLPNHQTKMLGAGNVGSLSSNMMSHHHHHASVGMQNNATNVNNNNNNNAGTNNNNPSNIVTSTHHRYLSPFTTTCDSGFNSVHGGGPVLHEEIETNQSKTSSPPDSGSKKHRSSQNKIQSQQQQQQQLQFTNHIQVPINFNLKNAPNHSSQYVTPNNNPYSSIFTGPCGWQVNSAALTDSMCNNNSPHVALGAGNMMVNNGPGQLLAPVIENGNNNSALYDSGRCNSNRKMMMVAPTITRQ